MLDVENRPKADQYARQTLAESVADFESTVIPHPQLERARKTISRLHDRSRVKKLKARCTLVLGESGAGKSTLLESYLKSYPSVTLEEIETGVVDRAVFSKAQLDRLREADLRRVIGIELKVRPTQRSITSEILSAFGYTAITSWTETEMLNKIKHYVAEFGTELILVDEAHHLINEKTPDANEIVSEFIKSILNRVGVQIVLAGLPKLRKFRDYKQLWRRLQPDVVLTPYDWCTMNGRVEFQALLGKFEKLLRLPQPSNLKEHDFAKRIYVACGGEIGVLAKYLSEALSQAHLYPCGEGRLVRECSCEGN